MEKAKPTKIVVNYFHIFLGVAMSIADLVRSPRHERGASEASALVETRRNDSAGFFFCFCLILIQEKQVIYPWKMVLCPWKIWRLTIIYPQKWWLKHPMVGKKQDHEPCTVPSEYTRGWPRELALFFNGKTCFHTVLGKVVMIVVVSWI